MSKAIDIKKAHPLIMDSFITAFECVLDQIEEQCLIETKHDDTPEEAQWVNVAGCRTICNHCGEYPLFDYFGRQALSPFCPNCGFKMTTEG